MKKQISFLFALAVMSFAAPAQADNYPISTLSGMTNDSITALIKTTAIGTDHRAYMGAAPMGLVFGLDVGVDGTAINFPQEFVSAMNTVTGSTTFPASTFIPRLNIHKGLPWGVDLGFTYFKYDTYMSLIGGEIKWAMLHGGATPAVALRGSAMFSSLWFLNTSTYKLDVVASQNLAIMEPYVGAGLQMWSGSLQIPGSVPVPAGLVTSANGISPHFYGGLGFKLLILRIGGEVDYSTTGILTYGGKVSLNF